MYACRLLAATLVGAIAAVPLPSLAQKSTAAATDFAREYQAWQKTPDPERQIGQLEELLRLEPTLKHWPLEVPRLRAKGELLFALGSAYRVRQQGDRADNLEKAIGAFQAALQVRTRETQPRERATTQNNLGVAYRERILGDRADNIEKAIGAYQAALQVYTREAQPRDWALTQNNLGVAYQHRILGDRADNIEKAIGAFQAALQVRTRETQPREWATTQSHLGVTYRERMVGDRADNIEKAIGAYQAALQVYTREAQPRDWATAQNNLGVAYRERMRGDRADNVEKAIGAYQAALQVYTREALPRDWALTQNNLGYAYRDRIRGDRADNLEKTIGAFEAALQVRTREAFPREWATAQVSLGVAYRERILGDRADNVEKAIAAYQAALQVRTREAQPRDWALTQNNLGVAYQHRILGDRADNMEKAIGAFQAALQVRTRETLPREWAEAQNNLGAAYNDRIHGDRADNLEKAIGAFQAALQVRTREAFPGAWAQMQNNLGVVYRERMVGDRADNVEKAIGAFQAALQVRTREAQPREWAWTHNNLGIAYQQRILGDRADNIEKTIGAYQAALQVRTREAQPREWATTQYNLGVAYRDRIRGDRADNLEKAIGAYQAALQVRTREALPRDHLVAARGLGAALLQAREWHRADVAYAGAREAFRLLFRQGLNEAEARHLIALAGPLFAESAFAAAQRGQSRAALILADEGKTQQMRVALRRQAVELPAAKRPLYAELTSGIREWEGLAEAADGTEAVQAWEELAARRKQLGELLAPHFRNETAVTNDLVPDGGAIVAPIITKFGSKLLLVTAGPAGPQVTDADLPELDSDRLDKLMRGDGSTVGARGGWLGAYQIQYLHGQQLEERFGEWIGAIDKIAPELWRLLGEAVDHGLRERGIKPGARVVLLPAASLGLLPLGLAQDLPSRPPLGDIYEIVYAPSLAALSSSRQQLAELSGPSMAAAINPTGDLVFTDIEGAVVVQHFARMSRSLISFDKSNAEPEVVVAALKGRSYWHFASHGNFDWNDVRASGLLMRHKEVLSIGRLLDAEGSLGHPRLVVLSACETGLYDISRNPEEFLGLPATFLQIGAAGVVSSLWPVDDLATALLVAKFYDLHMQEQLSPPKSLKAAQTWVRDATRSELLTYARDAAARAKLHPAQLAAFESNLTETRRTMRLRVGAALRADGGVAVALPAIQEAANQPFMESRPFKHPYYWGGFIYTGL